MTSGTRPLGVTALSFFFVFGALMSSLAAVMLLSPGSLLEPLWRLNPRAREGFTAMEGWAVLSMLAVCGACVTSAIGLWRRMRWGLWTAVAILSVNLAGDTADAIITHDWRTLIGLPIGAAMIFYLLRKRSVFAR